MNWWIDPRACSGCRYGHPNNPGRFPARFLAEQMPQEFKCSPFGKKVTKAASLLFRATAYAASVVCCLPPIGTTTCVVCVVGAGLAGDEIGDHIDEHCE